MSTLYTVHRVWCISGEKKICAYKIFDELKFWVVTKRFFHSHQMVELNGLWVANKWETRTQCEREREWNWWSMRGGIERTRHFINDLEILNLKLNFTSGKWWFSVYNIIVSDNKTWILFKKKMKTKQMIMKRIFKKDTTIQ